MKLNERMERRLVVFGYVVAGAVLIVAVGGQFRGEVQGSNQVEEQTEQTETVTIVVIPTETIEAATAEEKVEISKPDIVVRTEPEMEPPRVETTELTVVLPAQTDRMGQVVRPVLEKSTAPSEEVLRSPAQKPDGGSVEGTPETIPHKEVVQPSETSTQAREPQYGEAQNGKIHAPGFGRIGEIGERQGAITEDMYESEDKIGIMD